MVGALYACMVSFKINKCPHILLLPLPTSTAFYTKKESTYFDSIYTVWQYPKHSYSICGQLRSLPKILFAQTTPYRFRFLKICEIKSGNSRTSTLPYLNTRTPNRSYLRLTRVYFRRDGAPVCSLKVFNDLLGNYTKYGRRILHGSITRGHLSHCPFNCAVPNNCGGWKNGVSWILSFLND